VKTGADCQRVLRDFVSGDVHQLGNGKRAELDAARAEATLGEICDALRTEWGAYTEPASF
jgi:methylmalonyl-CoA mutase N-terminal domain/subunit